MTSGTSCPRSGAPGKCPKSETQPLVHLAPSLRLKHQSAHHLAYKPVCMRSLVAQRKARYDALTLNVNPGVRWAPTPSSTELNRDSSSMSPAPAL